MKLKNIYKDENSNNFIYSIKEVGVITMILNVKT